MADKTYTVAVVMTGNSQQAQAAVRQAKSAIGELNQALAGGLGLGAGLTIMGGAALGLTALVGVVKSSLVEFMAAEKVQSQVNAVLKSTGGIAGVTAAAVNEYADALSKVTRYEDDSIKSAESMLLTFTNIGSTVFPQAIEAVLNMTEKFGSMEAASVQVGKALQDPIQGVTALRKVGVMLTDQQEEQVKAFMAVNNLAAAQGVILKELETEVGGLARAGGQTMGGQIDRMNNAIGNMKEAIGGLAAETGIVDVTVNFVTRGSEGWTKFFQEWKVVRDWEAAHPGQSAWSPSNVAGVMSPGDYSLAAPPIMPIEVWANRPMEEEARRAMPTVEAPPDWFTAAVKSSDLLGLTGGRGRLGVLAEQRMQLTADTSWSEAVAMADKFGVSIAVISDQVQQLQAERTAYELQDMASAINTGSTSAAALQAHMVRMAGSMGGVSDAVLEFARKWQDPGRTLFSVGGSENNWSKLVKQRQTEQDIIDADQKKQAAENSFQNNISIADDWAAKMKGASDVIAGDFASAFSKSGSERDATRLMLTGAGLPDQEAIDEPLRRVAAAIARGAKDQQWDYAMKLTGAAGESDAQRQAMMQQYMDEAYKYPGLHPEAFNFPLARKTTAEELEKQAANEQAMANFGFGAVPFQPGEEDTIAKLNAAFTTALGPLDAGQQDSLKTLEQIAASAGPLASLYANPLPVIFGGGGGGDGGPVGDVTAVGAGKKNPTVTTGGYTYEVGKGMASGGVVPGFGPVPLTAHGGEGIFTPAQMFQMLLGKGGNTYNLTGGVEIKTDNPTGFFQQLSELMGSST